MFGARSWRSSGPKAPACLRRRFLPRRGGPPLRLRYDVEVQNSMPVDREFALPGSSARLRNFARRHGLSGFWAWWLTELSTFVPAAPRAAVQRRRMRAVLAFDADRATLWQPMLRDGRVAMVEMASIALSGDPAAIAAEGRAVLAKSSARAGAAPISASKIVVSLAPRATLRKMLVLPEAVENDLR